MPTLSTRVTDAELKAITEYANVSGLTVSDLIKKVLMHKVCWLWIGRNKDKYFDELYCVEPENSIDDHEELTDFINRFRKYVGVSPLDAEDF